VTVKLSDKREFKAKLVGIDRPTDTAVLKVDADGLPAVRLGDPAQAAVGDWVLAIGSPFGFENSVSAGIISAKSRSLPNEGFVPFIQTDVAVNPGNSGGPLFNANGEVIGINSQIYSQSGGYQGLSFAVPIDVALKVEQQLLLNGKVSRGRLGLSAQAVTQALANSFGLDKTSGVLVISVGRDGSAAKAGIEPGDIILKMNGADMTDPAQMGALVSDLKPGSQATVNVWRNAKLKVIAMPVIEADDGTPEAIESAGLSESRLGLAVRALKPDGVGQAEGTGGLEVEQSSGPSARAGIAPGDVILSVNGRLLTNAGQLRDLVAKAGKHVALLVRRRDEKLFVAIDLG
jgi:serine protease Do